MPHHEFRRPDATIGYRTTGPDHAHTVVLLHGATLDHRAWDPQVEAWRDRFRLVVPDLRGHGRSTGPFRFGAAVDDVVALLDRLPADPVVLVGLSLGGNIAQEVVRRHPERVRALVAADTTCNTAARHPLAASAGIAALHADALFDAGGFARRAARAVALEPDVQRYALAVNAHRSHGETIAILSSLLTDALHADPDYRIPVPALLLHGQHDHIGDIAAGTRAWARREPLAGYATVPAAGHASNLDNPEAFTAVVTAFLDGVLLPVGPGPRLAA